MPFLLLLIPAFWIGGACMIWHQCKNDRREMKPSQRRQLLVSVCLWPLTAGNQYTSTRL